MDHFRGLGPTYSPLLHEDVFSLGDNMVDKVHGQGGFAWLRAGRNQANGGSKGRIPFSLGDAPMSQELR